MIRAAKPQDINEVRELVMLASKIVFQDALKSTDDIKIEELFNLFYKTKDTKFSMENTIVYEHNKEVAGCLVYYDSNNEKLYNSNMEHILNNGYKFPIEGIKNTIYIDSIAVSPKYRGLKISKKLFEYIIDNSKVSLSLLVETFKDDVQLYYEYLGFKKINTINSFGSELNLMLLEKQ